MGLLWRLRRRWLDLEYSLDDDRCADGRAVYTVHDTDVSRLGAEKFGQRGSRRRRRLRRAQQIPPSSIRERRLSLAFLACLSSPACSWAAAKAFNAAKRAALIDRKVRA